MTQTIALVRQPSLSFTQAISSHREKHTINIARARLQHQNYVSILEENGIEVITLPALEEFPDSSFVEDTTVVFDDVALACSSKEKSRQGEGESIHTKIKKYRRIESLPKSVFLDGGDVLNTEEKLFVGISSRTNLGAVDIIAKFARKPVVPIEVASGLHLKSMVTYLGENVLVLNSSSINNSSLQKFKWIETDEPDHYAANCLAIGNKVLVAAGTRNLADKIRAEGFKAIELDMSEFEKADGGPTCLSIIFKK